MAADGGEDMGPMNGIRVEDTESQTTDRLDRRVERLEQAVSALVRLEQRADFEDWRRQHRPAVPTTAGEQVCRLAPIALPRCSAPVHARRP
jgi:hypothetical protein